MALISVIVPVYKVEDYLDKCVESIVAQTYTNLEIILVDDGSPDNCGAMCDEWAKKDSRIRVIHKENGGLSDARNAGMAVATGEYIAFVDSDDWIDPTMYETLYTSLTNDQSDIAACGIKMVWESNGKERRMTTTFKGVLKRDEAQEALLRESYLLQPVWYKLYRRETLEDIPFEFGKYHEDAFWSYQVIGRAKQVSVVPDELYFYVQRDGSIMGVSYSSKRLHALEAMCDRQEYLKREFPSLLNLATVNLWLLLLYHGQNVLLHLDKEEKKKAMTYLKSIKSQYPLPKEALAATPFKRKIWLYSEMVSLSFTCWFRNCLRIGQ